MIEFEDGQRRTWLLQTSSIATITAAATPGSTLVTFTDGHDITIAVPYERVRQTLATS